MDFVTNQEIIMLAPIGSLQSITPEGGVAVAKAAEAFGTINFVSSVTQPSLEEIASASRNPKVFQLYVQGDLKWIEDLLHRVSADQGTSTVRRSPGRPWT